MGSSQAVDQLPENSLNYQGTTSYLQTSSNNGTSWVSNYASDACFRFSLDPSQPTLTMTFTQTPTATAAATGTASNTVTATTTISPTYTDTPTVTVTATVTLTPESTPDDNNVLDKNYADVSKGDVVNIRVNTAAAGTAVKVKVYNLTGGVIRKFSAISNAAGWNDITWDIKNDGGKTVGQGLYFIEIESQGVKKLRRIYVLK
jgi:flagellar hook assembly protein FlgD